MSRLDILFIESDDLHLDQVVKTAGKEYNIFIAQSFRDSLRWLNKKKFHAIIADFFQEDFKLKELFKQMKARNIRCPIIIYSAADEDFLLPLIGFAPKRAILFASKWAPLSLFGQLHALKKKILGQE